MGGDPDPALGPGEGPGAAARVPGWVAEPAPYDRLADAVVRAPIGSALPAIAGASDRS